MSEQELTAENDAPEPLKGCGWCGFNAGHTTDEHVARWGNPDRDIPPGSSDQALRGAL